MSSGCPKWWKVCRGGRARRRYKETSWPDRQPAWAWQRCIEVELSHAASSWIPQVLAPASKWQRPRADEFLRFQYAAIKTARAGGGKLQIGSSSTQWKIAFRMSITVHDRRTKQNRHLGLHSPMLICDRASHPIRLALITRANSTQSSCRRCSEAVTGYALRPSSQNRQFRSRARRSDVASSKNAAAL